MKKYILYILGIISLVVSLSSCSEDDLSGTSVIKEPIGEKNEFDKWIEDNYIIPYNIELKYRMEDIETDMNYQWDPADYNKSIRMAKMIQYLTLQTYDELMDNDKQFMRSHYPKILFLVGSPGYKNNGTIILATAENGWKITINNVNALPKTRKLASSDLPLLNRYYFKTLHHEFAHILHQKKPYTSAFNEISGSDYVQDSWSSKYNDNTSLPDGFITTYASSAVDEDFVELYSVYITSTKEEWDKKIEKANVLTDEDKKNGKISGAIIINSKLDIVKNYMNSVWGIDMDKLREIVLRRQVDVFDLDLDTLN